ncbi:hypothetical protein ACFOYU_22365 [Microvirga sp. GCM10011540]|uniref:hypothetical protein n=1 Tax=Microvirga sp. GCM10011540 TaxID=3317338 RepID=UPI00360C949F
MSNLRLALIDEGRWNVRAPAPDLDPNAYEEALDRALLALREIERRYDWEKAAIEETLHPQPWKDWRLEQLSKRRRREREPLVQLVCSLHHQATCLQMVSGLPLAAREAPGDRPAPGHGRRAS